MPESLERDSAGGAVGILGGTFDPVHLAHLALARAALERLGIAQVLWIPAGQPPHRAPPRAAAGDRLAMVRAAIAGEPRFLLDGSEVESAEPSYTVHTLERLRHRLGADLSLVVLMGADAFRGLAGWHRWRDLLALAHIAVATRPGFPLDDLPEPLAGEFSARRTASADFSASPQGTIHAFELVAGTVSATEVRGLVASEAPVARLRELLPMPVVDYILRHKLYRN